MAEFTDSAMTRLGNTAAAQALAGMKLTFTRIVFGDGYVPEDAAVEEMTDVAHACADIPVTRIKVHPENTANVGGTYINDSLEEGYWWREIGLYALMPETGEEILFSYANAGELAEWIPATSASTVWEKRIDLYVYVGSKASVNVAIKPDSYVTREQLEDELANVTDSLAFVDNDTFLAAIGLSGGLPEGDGPGEPGSQDEVEG